MQNLFAKTGIYMRLSRDDEKSGESASIESQRVILTNYVAERGGTIIDEYVDDGWSGTNFDRPAVKRMLADAQSGRINTVIVKDLSRFGRNYIQVGQYIDYIFPAYGIRFIALSDNVDTADRTSTAMDMMPIMNVFNEWHAANTSKKIRTVLEASQRAGKYTNSVYPYGYKVGLDENRTAVIDGEAASTVRRIFAMRAEGKSFRTIARILTDEKIPNPATYYTRLDGGKIDKPFSPYWCASTIRRILTDKTYVGNTEQHKTTSVSYKNHMKINVPCAERIVRENAHEAIINIELWEKVQEINNSVATGKSDKSDKVHALSGLLVCADCGKKLKLKTSNRKFPNSEVCSCSFVCRTYTDLGKKYCTSHSVSEREIENIVLLDIRSMLGNVPFDEHKARETFIKGKAKSVARNRFSDENKLGIYKTRLTELDKLIQTAFEERVLKNLPESVCAELCGKYSVERAAVEAEISAIGQRLAKTDGDEDEAEEYVRRLKSYGKCEKLTREMCLQLIAFITVGEKNEADGSRNIDIYYKFAEKNAIKL